MRRSNSFLKLCSLLRMVVPQIRLSVLSSIVLPDSMRGQSAVVSMAHWHEAVMRLRVVADWSIHDDWWWMAIENSLVVLNPYECQRMYVYGLPVHPTKTYQCNGCPLPRSLTCDTLMDSCMESILVTMTHHGASKGSEHSASFTPLEWMVILQDIRRIFACKC